MENILNDVPGCVVYIDDILITGRSDEEHLQNLRQVLNQLQEKGIKLKKNKFDFMLDKDNYLGLVISSTGISPILDKVKAIHKAKAPQNVAELQSFIGMANYLPQFIPNFAEIMSPLYKLLRKNINWRWGVEEQQAFIKIKASITSEQVLRHYDPSAPLVLQVDASSIGVRAFMLQPEDGTLKPVAYASRILTNAEKKYSQIEKESLVQAISTRKTFHLRQKEILYSEKHCFIRDLARLKNQLRNYCLTTIDITTEDSKFILNDRLITPISISTT